MTEVFFQYVSNLQQPAALSQSFYDNVSTIIKLFRKQLTLFIRLSQSFIQQSELLEQMLKKKQQGLTITKQYENLIVGDSTYTIMQRFIGRIKEILQLTNNVAPGFLQFISSSVKKIQTTLHKNIGVINAQQVFSDILHILPSYFQSKVPNPENVKLKVKHNKENIPIVQRKQNSVLNQILQSYKKSVSLFSTLDIDQYQYRNLFFSARDDWHRGSSNLQNQMKYRNRFIRQEMTKYDFGYQNFKEKIEKDRGNLNKKQFSRMKKMMPFKDKNQPKKNLETGQCSKTQEENQKNNLKFLPQKSAKDQKRSYSPNLFMIQAKVEKSNLLTAYNFNKSIREASRYSNVQNLKQSSKNQNYQKEIRINRAENYHQKARENEFQDFVNEIKVKGEFRMTKVLFGKNGKLELSPFTGTCQKLMIQKPSTAANKNKIIFRKAQQNIRKKLGRLTTQPPSINLHHRPGAKLQGSSSVRTEKNIYLSSQPSQQINKSIAKKVNKATWKEKEIKFMGIKGINYNKN